MLSFAARKDYPYSQTTTCSGIAKKKYFALWFIWRSLSFRLRWFYYIYEFVNSRDKEYCARHDSFEFLGCRTFAYRSWYWLSFCDAYSIKLKWISKKILFICINIISVIKFCKFWLRLNNEVVALEFLSRDFLCCWYKPKTCVKMDYVDCRHFVRFYRKNN